MAAIKTVEVYKYKGTTYNKLSDIKDQVENNLGACIDSVDILPPKLKLKILQMLIDNRTTLIDNLSVEFEVESDNVMYMINKNILDL